MEDDKIITKPLFIVYKQNGEIFADIGDETNHYELLGFLNEFVLRMSLGGGNDEE